MEELDLEQKSTRPERALRPVSLRNKVGVQSKIQVVLLGELPLDFTLSLTMIAAISNRILQHRFRSIRRARRKPGMIVVQRD